MSVGILELKDGVLVNKTYATKGIKTVTDKGFFGFEIISGHLWLVYGAIKPDIVLTEDRHLIIDFDGNVQVEDLPPSNVPLGDVINPFIVCEYDKIRLRWGDPENITYKGVTIAEWEGTKLVRKAGYSPIDPEDGEVLLDSKTRDQYKTALYEDITAERGIEYFYALYPYTTGGIYTMSDNNILSGQLLDDYVIGDPTNVYIYQKWGSFQINWADPVDLIVDNVVRASWQKTTIVKNAEHYPESISDGTVLVENTKRSTNNLKFDENLENDVKYYYGFFITTVDGNIKKCLLSRLEAVGKVNLNWAVTKIGTYGFEKGYSQPYTYSTPDLTSTSYIAESKWTVTAESGEPFVVRFMVYNYYFACEVTLIINGEKVLDSDYIGRHTNYNNKNVAVERIYERETVEGVNTVQAKIVPKQTSTSAINRGYVKFVRKVEQINE